MKSSKKYNPLRIARERLVFCLRDSDLHWMGILNMIRIRIKCYRGWNCCLRKNVLFSIEDVKKTRLSEKCKIRIKDQTRLKPGFECLTVRFKIFFCDSLGELFKICTFLKTFKIIKVPEFTTDKYSRWRTMEGITWIKGARRSSDC